VLPDVDVYSKTGKKYGRRKNNLLKTKNTRWKYKVSGGADFAFRLPGKAVVPLPLSSVIRHCPKRSPFLKDKLMAE